MDHNHPQQHTWNKTEEFNAYINLFPTHKVICDLKFTKYARSSIIWISPKVIKPLLTIMLMSYTYISEMYISI